MPSSRVEGDGYEAGGPKEIGDGPVVVVAVVVVVRMGDAFSVEDTWEDRECLGDCG